MRPVLALVPVVLWAAPAAAEDEQSLSLGLGYASFSAPGEKKLDMAPTSTAPDWGSGLFASYERMIGSDVGLRGELAANLFHGGNSDKQSAMSYAGVGDVGLVFRFDVLHFVPYAFVGVGGVYSIGGPIDRGLDYVVSIGGGIDWLQSRERSYGLEIRLASFAGDVTVATVGLRGTRRWGFF